MAGTGAEHDGDASVDATRARWIELLEQLPIHEDDQAVLAESFARLDPEHGLRAMMAVQLERLVARAGEDAQREFDAFTARVPEVPRFSFMPLADVSLIHVRAATLLSPERRLAPACNGQTRTMVRGQREVTVMRGFIDAADGDPLRFLEIWTGESARNLIENFGTAELSSPGGQHAIIRFREHYPGIAQFYIRGVFEGLLDWFEVDGEVRFEQDDATGFSLDVRWS